MTTKTTPAMLRAGLLALTTVVLLACAPGAWAASPADGPAASAAQTAPDRDSDGIPDSSDSCPDQPGPRGNQGCPPPPQQQPPQQQPDRDFDGVPDSADKCPDTNARTPNGCEPSVWRIFFLARNIDDFLTGKGNLTRCEGEPGWCKTTNVVLTLSAATAKAAGIRDREIANYKIAIPYLGYQDSRIKPPAESNSFDNHIAKADRKKLARLKKIVVEIETSVTLTDGKVIKCDPATRTVTRKKGFMTQFNSIGKKATNET